MIIVNCVRGTWGKRSGYKLKGDRLQFTTYFQYLFGIHGRHYHDSNVFVLSNPNFFIIIVIADRPACR